ncbi:integral membrane protein [Hypoxylon sp. EC38]|nr:integral membrane protein [Hypoxylon sp. EC38]
MALKNLGPSVVAIAWTSTLLSGTVLFGRFYVRLRILQRLTIDDWIVAITFLLAFGNSIFLTIAAAWGLGQHVDVLAPQLDSAMYTIKWVYLCEFFGILAPGFGRISYAFLLLGLTPPCKMKQRFLWTIICAQLIVDVGIIIISFAQCKPIYGYWDNDVEANCWPPHVQQYAGYFQGSVCSVVDLILALFPAGLFWNLKMETKQKISLSCMMGLGIFALAASIIKTINLRAFTDTTDLTYAMARLAIWWTLEAHLVLLAVSIPTLRPILKNVKVKKRARINNNLENNGPFHHLEDSMFVADISSDNGFQSKGVCGHRMGPIDTKDYQAHGKGVIRKDITISVTFGEPASEVKERGKESKTNDKWEWLAHNNDSDIRD